VARYATADHYRSLRDALGEVRDELRAAGHRAVVVADDNALVDRAAAVRAGIGWYGKSSNVLLPGRGSWYVLGSVITDADLVPAAGPVPDGCGSCRRCLDGCPTGAIVAPGVVDARRCLAWLLQAEGPFPPEFRAALGDRIYGCDDCQEVCPPTRRAPEPPPTGRPGAGGEPPSSWVDLVWMLEADDHELLARCGRWYVPRRDPDSLRRNALVALGNVAARDDLDPADLERVDAVLRHHLRGGPLLSEHAAWAARRAGRTHLLDPDGRQGETAPR
jgi:epoxyqueuosine reductase